MSKPKRKPKRRRKKLSPAEAGFLFGVGTVIGFAMLARLHARHRNPVPPTVPALPPLRPLGRIIDVEAIVKDKGA